LSNMPANNIIKTNKYKAGYLTPKQAAELLNVKYDNLLTRYVSTGYFKDTLHEDGGYLLSKKIMDPYIEAQREYENMTDYFYTGPIQ